MACLNIILKLQGNKKKRRTTIILRYSRKRESIPTCYEVIDHPANQTDVILLCIYPKTDSLEIHEQWHMIDKSSQKQEDLNGNPQLLLDSP